MKTDAVSYPLNYSQDIITLQTKYSLFSRVANIMFSTTVDGGFDEALMIRAINLLFDRNDCLRITFFKKDGQTFQRFEQKRQIGAIPSVRFSSAKEMDAFFKRFRKKQVSPFKGETLKVVFGLTPEGKQTIIFKISHLVADSYGIGVLVNDLFSVYDALKDGKELPPLPGSFETVLAKDTQYKSDVNAVNKDREFFTEYYCQKHSERPIYCGIHGAGSDRWMKQKAAGKISLPYLFIKCDTQGYRFVIPSSVTLKVEDWCKANGVTMTAFFFYAYSVATSLLNDKAPVQTPLILLNCRGTLAERKAAGTKVQSMGVCACVDWNRSFKDNLLEAFEEQNELFRHTRLTYLEVEALQHKLWNYSMLSQLTGFCFSYIPVTNPKGVELQIHSNGKGALVTYLAMMHNTDTNEVYVNYDIQTKMVTPGQLIEFQNIYVHLIETVLADSESSLNDLGL